MINNTESKKLYKVQSGVTEYPIRFPFQFDSDGVPQLAVSIGTTYLQLNYNCKLSEDNGTLILIPTEEEAETLTGPEDYSWMDKWVDAPLVITRDIPFVQESDYQVGRISPEQIEKDFDLSVMRDQILLDKIGEHTTDVSEELESLHTDISDINAELATKATKAELDNYKLTANAAIDANATAIQKTREDFASADQAIRADMNAKDSELETILNDHTKRLDTLRTDHDDLGDDVADIQAKIPESASGSNPLVTKQQLLDEEMDIRDDMNQSDSELQAQITAQAAAIALLDSEKLDKNQGDINAGKYLVVGNDGNIELTSSGGGGSGGISSVAHDETLSGAGTDASPLGLATAIKDEIADKAPKETVEALTQVINGIIGDYVKKSGDTMTGALNVPEITVQTAEGTFTVSVVAGVVTIATNNGLDIVAQTKFDTAPTTDDNTTYANALDVSLMRKAQVATAIADALANIDALPDQTGNAGKVLTTDGTTASWQEPSGGTTITLKEYDE